MKLRLGVGIAVVAIATGTTYGCGGSGGSDIMGFGGGGNGAGHGSNNGGQGAGILDGSGGNNHCATHCSADLHDVLDCNDRIVKSCPMGQGCGASGCVDPCESAKENKSSVGCDYYSVDPDIISAGAGACFAAYVANTWDTPVTITLERGGTMLNLANSAVIPTGSGMGISYAPLPNGQLPPGQVAIVFMAQSPSAPIAHCPAGVTPAVAVDPAVHGTGLGQAFHLVTSAPVVVYDIFPYGGGSAAATSATLLLPTSAWDTNYVGVDAFRKSTFVPAAQPSMDIVAQEDGTNVTILPTAAIVAGAGVAGTPLGTPMTYALNKGQILQFTQNQELIGSAIQADKPIGVWGAASCLNIDVGVQACDSAHQQIPPVKALGSEYVAVRFRNRHDGEEETPPWRFVGAVDGTALTYDPAPPAGAPTMLNVGQVAEFKSAGGFSVKSQDGDHPFYISAHMEGCQTYDHSPGLTDCRGDPEFVNVIPPAQYLDSYVFFTDPTYPETNLVLVRKKTKAGMFEDVNLDCSGVVGGWAPLGSNGDYQFTRVDLVTGNFQGVNGCDNGRHTIKSNAPFGLTVWGWGSAASAAFQTQAVSYAYPAGASVRPINQVVVPPVPK